MKYHNIHIGKLIKQKFEQKNMSIALFAKAIHCSRTNVYHIFNAKSIDIDKLILISNVLNYNFLDEYFLDDFSALQTQITLDIELKDVKVNIKQVEHV